MNPRCSPGAVAAALLVALAAGPAAGNLDAEVAATLAFAEQQLLDTLVEVPDPSDHPRSTDPGTGLWTTKGSQDWTSGFFPGLLWLVGGATDNTDLLDAAPLWTLDITGQATRTDTHDLGFMIGVPFSLGYAETGEAAYLATTLVAADSLASRFDPDVGAVRSWDWGSWSFPVIIDNMMNLELLFRGASLTGDPGDAATWTARAVSHGGVSSAEHRRPDGSTYHIVDFDPATGDVLSKQTWQGVSASTTWSRGQSWGLYGFTMTYRETGDPARLADAMALADFYLDNVPADHVPYWDYEASDIPDEPRDTSAAAIAASGLLELSTLVPEPTDQLRYRVEAEAILASLMSPAYLSDGAESSGLLLHGTGSKPHGNEVDVTLIYGDYYFVEALLRYQTLRAVPVPAPVLSRAGVLVLVALFLTAGFAVSGAALRRADQIAK